MLITLLKCVFEVLFDKFLGFMINQWGIKVKFDKIWALFEIWSPVKSKEIQILTRRVPTLCRFALRAIDKCSPFFQVLKGRKMFEWTWKCDQAFQALN